MRSQHDELSQPSFPRLMAQMLDCAAEAGNQPLRPAGRTVAAAFNGETNSTRRSPISQLLRPIRRVRR